MRLEHGRPLEFAPYAQPGDGGLVEPGQVVAAVKQRLPFVRPRLAGDDVHHGRFAGTVRPDDGAQLARLQIEAQPVERPEAVEADGDGVKIERGIAEQAAVLVDIVYQHEHGVFQRRLADRHRARKGMQDSDLDRLGHGRRRRDHCRPGEQTCGRQAPYAARHRLHCDSTPCTGCTATSTASCVPKPGTGSLNRGPNREPKGVGRTLRARAFPIAHQLCGVKNRQFRPDAPSPPGWPTVMFRKREEQCREPACPAAIRRRPPAYSAASSLSCVRSSKSDASWRS